MLVVGEMILLSNVFKEYETTIKADKRIIGLKPFMSNSLRNENEEMVAENNFSFEEEWEIFLAEKEKIEKELEEKKLEYENYIKRENEILENKRADWEDEFYVLSEQAKKDGYERGIELGREEMTLAFEGHITEAKNIALQIENRYYSHLEKQDEIVMSIGVKVAQEIVQTTLDKDNEAFLSVIEKVLQELKDQSLITIRIHPVHYYKVTEQIEEWKEWFSPETLMNVIVEDSFEQNDLFIDTPFGKIDASIKTQIELVREKLMELVEGTIL